mgnify:CR=1 FL=1
MVPMKIVLIKKYLAKGRLMDWYCCYELGSLVNVWKKLFIRRFFKDIKYYF